MTDTTQQQYQALLQGLYSSDQQQPPLLLDCRHLGSFWSRRLLASCCVPLHTLFRRGFLLPDRECPFAVVVPAVGAFRVVLDRQQESGHQQQHPQQHEQSKPTAAFLKGAGSLEEFLGRWTVSCWLHDSPALWAAAQALQLLEVGRPCSPAALRRCLFAPSPLLAQSISVIEASLLQQQQQQGGAVVLQALDVGCGSGRDACWLAGRRNGSVQWRVTALDSRLDALERAADCAAAMQLPHDSVRLLFARVSVDNGQLSSLRVPPKSSLGGSRYLCAADDAQEQLQQLHGQLHLIVCSRVLIRALLPRLQPLLAPGGWLLYSTFLDGPGTQAFGRPSGPEHLLQPGELARDHFGPAQGFRVQRDDVSALSDGREVCMFAAERL